MKKYVSRKKNFYLNRIWKEGEILTVNDDVSPPKHFTLLRTLAAQSDKTFNDDLLKDQIKKFCKDNKVTKEVAKAIYKEFGAEDLESELKALEVWKEGRDKELAIKTGKGKADKK